MTRVGFGKHRDRFHNLLRYLSLTLLAVLALTPAPVAAQYIFRQANLAYLARRADVIVQGRVASVKYEPLPGYEHIPTVVVTLEVDKMLRGPQTTRFTFRQMMPFLRSARGKNGTYALGQELLLFLPSASQYGLSSPLGHEQGTFHIARDSQGHKFIANEFNNGSLFKGVAQEAAEEGLALTEQQTELMSGTSGPIEVDKFIPLVKSLLTLPRIQ